MARENERRDSTTDHNVNNAIALECKFEEGKLVIPVDDIAFDRRGFSSGTAQIQKWLGYRHQSL
jgi:hypothetical protein